MWEGEGLAHRTSPSLLRPNGGQKEAGPRAMWEGAYQR